MNINYILTASATMASKGQCTWASIVKGQPNSQQTAPQTAHDFVANLLAQNPEQLPMTPEEIASANEIVGGELMSSQDELVRAANLMAIAEQMEAVAMQKQRKAIGRLNWLKAFDKTDTSARERVERLARKGFNPDAVKECVNLLTTPQRQLALYWLAIMQLMEVIDDKRQLTHDSSTLSKIEIADAFAKLLTDPELMEQYRVERERLVPIAQGNPYGW